MSDSRTDKSAAPSNDPHQWLEEVTGERALAWVRARKMVARMLEYGISNVVYYENIEGGHGGAANNRQFAHKAALKYEFLRRSLRSRSRTSVARQYQP